MARKGQGEGLEADMTALIIPPHVNQLPGFPYGLYRNIVAQLGAHLFQVASCQVVDGDQLPVAVSLGDLDSVDRRDLFFGLPGCRDPIGAEAGESCSDDYPKSDRSHSVPP